MPVKALILYSIYYNIFNGKIQKKLPLLVGGYAVAAGLPVEDAETFVGTYLTEGSEAAQALPGVTAGIIEAALTGSQWAFADSLAYVWYVSIAFGCCAMICAILIPKTGRFQTNRIAVELS